jgi:serine/threonine protein kinase
VKLYPGMTLPAEPRLMGQVRHPNVVSIFGAAVHDGRPGIWMECIEGRSLADRVRTDGPLPPETATRIGIDLCDALSAVHEAGLVHQDVKPHNVIEDKAGRIVLMDFGAGRHGDSPVQDLAGTPLYMASEVLLGSAPTVQSDVYALGVLLFYLLTGTYPLYGTNVQELRRLHERLDASRRPRSIAGLLLDLGPGVPAPLAHCVAQALAPIEERYKSAAELRSALEQAGRSGATSRARLAFAALALAILAAASWLSWRSLSTRPTEAPSVPAPVFVPAPATMTAAARAPAPPSNVADHTAPPEPPPLRTKTPVPVETTPPTAAAEPATPSPTSSLEDRGVLRIVVTPWATVEVDGIEIGVTPPMKPVRLPVGDHTIRLLHPGYEPFRRTVTIRTNETSTLEVDLAREAFPR